MNSTEERGAVCIYCGHVIACESDADVPRVYAEAVAHDAVCQANPIVKQRDALVASLELMNTHRDSA